MVLEIFLVTFLDAVTHNVTSNLKDYSVLNVKCPPESHCALDPQLVEGATGDDYDLVSLQNLGGRRPHDGTALKVYNLTLLPVPCIYLLCTVENIINPSPAPAVILSWCVAFPPG